MSAINAALVKELRDKTGAGMMDCKKALVETKGNVEEAIDWLRKKGISGADKKSSRVAADGVIAISSSENSISLLEINSETDFVSKNPDFQNFVRNVSNIALNSGTDIEALKNANYDGNKSVSQVLTELIAKIGENIVLRRANLIKSDNSVFSHYIHGQVAEGMGKIGVVISIESNGDKTKIHNFGKQLSMHIAAAKPIAVSAEDVDKNIIDRERNILIEQAKDSGKSDNIIEKMVEGRISKFFSDITLLDQIWVIDGERKVSKIIKDTEKELNCNIKINEFKCYILGEGIDVEKKDFAKEVTEQVNN